MLKKMAMAIMAVGLGRRKVNVAIVEGKKKSGRCSQQHRPLYIENVLVVKQEVLAQRPRQPPLHDGFQAQPP